MTYLRKFNKLLRRICQLKTNEYYSNAQILDQFIVRLKDKLIKKVYSHALKNLTTAIQQAKNYEMTMEEANRTKLVNLAIGETSLAAKKKIDQLTKKQSQQPQRYQSSQRRNQNNFGPPSNNQIQNCHYYQQQRNNQCYPPPQQFYYQPPPPTYYSPRSQYQSNYYQPVSQPIQQQYQQPPTQYYQVPARKLIPQNQFTSQNQYQINNNRINLNNQLNFCHTVLLKGRAAAQQQNPSYTSITISPARIAENANLSNIFLFEFEANESPFLLSNAAANEQKAITAMYTEAEIERKPIHLILDSESAGSIIIYQLIQQLKKNVDQPAQTIIVTADGMKKTPVGKIDNFLFTIDGITIPVKVLIINASQYQALVRNDWLQKANANLNWETQELTIFYQGQHARVPATCGTFNKRSEKVPAFEFEPKEEKPIIETFMALESTFNWADKTEQHIPLPSESDEYEIEFREPEAIEEIKVTPVYLIENQPALQLKYFNNNGQEIKPEKAHKIDAEYDLRYSGKNTFTLKPKSLTKINLKIALEIPLEAIVQITSRSSLASKKLILEEES
ncbi:hypothetical protein G9A89_004850 [Geosiphon pyriformis]|nr:hypothetical protein G9A89_004850 [Geosiphon pyriformis]